VRFLDVGQGDATIIQNGGSTVVVDAGPSRVRFAHLLDSLGISSIDVLVISHAHQDHYGGIEGILASRHRVSVRYIFENRDAGTAAGLARVRDSINARVARQELVIRDTDDPCANGSPTCTIELRGGARLHVMRPAPGPHGANNRSTPLKLVGPDSASFTMWLSGDAEHEAIDWFDVAGYDTVPGMRVDVLKLNHHGSCNGITPDFLRLTSPKLALIGVGSGNSYGHVHRQTKLLLARGKIPWLRTDQNGSITIRSPGTPGSGYSVEFHRGAYNEGGAADRTSRQEKCMDGGVRDRVHSRGEWRTSGSGGALR
jgi:competence protein ComEC